MKVQHLRLDEVVIELIDHVSPTLVGYFINDIDEIRSIENHDYYFKYYLTKNERWNERHRFAFDEAVRREIHRRLDAQGFTSIPLPLGTPAAEAHVPIRTTPDLAGASRVVLLFGEPCQPLGVPGNRTVGEHVRTVFEAILGAGLVDEKAKLDVIAVGNTVEEVVNYLDDDEVWGVAGGRLGCMVVLGGCYNAKKFRCEGFTRFVAERARAYVIHHAPLDTPVAGPEGSPDTAGCTSYGCPVFSAGAAKETETMLIEAQPAVLKWMQEVAMEGEAYKNPVVEISGDSDGGVTAEEANSWWGVTEEGCNAPDEREAQRHSHQRE
ncbi:hypothetical protein VTH06DRAFT_4402 [Thermothelomyces fergusii]